MFHDKIETSNKTYLGLYKNYVGLLLQRRDVTVSLFSIEMCTSFKNVETGRGRYALRYELNRT